MVAEQLLRDPALFARVQGMQVSHPLQVVEEYLEWPVRELCGEIAARYPQKDTLPHSLKASLVPTFPYRLLLIDRRGTLWGVPIRARYLLVVWQQICIVRNLRHCLALDSKECFSVWELRNVDVLRNHLRRSFAHLSFSCNVMSVMFS